MKIDEKKLRLENIFEEKTYQNCLKKYHVMTGNLTKRNINRKEFKDAAEIG